MQNFLETTKNESVGDMLRFWRNLKRISQLDLALDVGISSKHLSFVETGKSQPSRSLLLRIAESLKLPLRHQNAFLTAAGYASVYGEESFNGQKMVMVRQALQRMLEKHEPYPAFVVNAAYKILMSNSGFEQTVKVFLGENILEKYDNIYRILFAEDGLQQFIVDWPVVEKVLFARLWDEAVSTQNSELISLYKEISKLRTGEDPMDIQMDYYLPVMSMTLENESIRASFFSTITTLGTPLDLATQELRIEALYPADEETKQLFPSGN